MLPTDYVVKACVVEDKNCELKKKCAECIKEMKALDEIDEIFFYQIYFFFFQI